MNWLGWTIVAIGVVYLVAVVVAAVWIYLKHEDGEGF